MRFSIAAISFLVSILLFTHIALLFSTTDIPKTQRSSKAVVAAYFCGWNSYGKNGYSVEDIYPIAHKLTHILYAFAKPNPQTGLCELQDPWADVGASTKYHKKLGGNFAKLLILKEKFPHLKILLSIGGGCFSKNISEIVQKKMQKKFISSCVKLLDTYTYTIAATQEKPETIAYTYATLFDGIDIDWEWTQNVVPPEDAKAYLAMVTHCKELLNKRGKRLHKKQLLTLALQTHTSVCTALPLKQVESYIDWFNFMAYNFASVANAGIGFNAPIYNPWSLHSVDNAVKGLIHLAGITSQKVVLGIPLYGYVFDQTDGKLGTAFEKTDITGAFSYNKIKDLYLANKACLYKWHTVAHVPYLHCPEDKIFVSFDDQKSIQKKVEYAKKHALRGIVFWHLAQDDDCHSLVHAV